ncbi:MAG: phosphotransferase [Planctomycetota bacterium]
MWLLDEQSAADYLRAVGRVEGQDHVEVTWLSGGVSNVVLHVQVGNPAADPRGCHPHGHQEFVLKQARNQLRVPEPWFCSVERIRTEVAVLKRYAELASSLPTPAQVPRVLFEDPAQYAFAMTAAPRGHRTWKQCLLAGEYDESIATACGGLLGVLHGATWHQLRDEQQFADRTFFDDLRLDPYYRHVARGFPELATPLQQLIDSVWSERHALVHADFSPKNLLVWPGGLMLIDCEVGHYGDPAFDLGFFLAHLVLKTFRVGGPRETAEGAACYQLTNRFWDAYRRSLSERVDEASIEALEGRGIANLAGCLLARLDGKSQVDYLTDKSPVRAAARRLLLAPPRCWQDVEDLLFNY